MAPRRQTPPVEAEPTLRVPSTLLEQEIDERATLGRELRETDVESMDEFEALEARFHTWDEYNEQLFRARFTAPKIADEYKRATFGYVGRGNLELEVRLLREAVDSQLRKLTSIKARLPLYAGNASNSTPTAPQERALGSKIFLVHGHDGEAKLQVAEYLEQVTGNRPIILHEQADSGRTVIEKFEEHASTAGFAVILLTADDIGNSKDASNMNERARQNVVFEFGFFVGQLGRDRVVALYENGVELPSDIAGFLYKPLAGNWHTELARELRAAGIPANLSSLR
jgi:predicted nucleotide-binding protein